MFKTNILTFLALIIVAGFTAVTTFAQYNPGCASVYGAACPTSNLNLNKTVKNPQTGAFVDSLSANDPTFLPQQQVDFRIDVSNKGNTDLNNVTVNDQFPNFVIFISGPGTFDNNTKTLNWNIGLLKAGETQTFQVTGKIIDGKSIPNTGITCVTNSSTARQGQLMAQDTTPFCIQTQVLGVTQQLPVTGPKETAIIFLFSASLLITSGVLLAKLNKI